MTMACSATRLRKLPLNPFGIARGYENAADIAFYSTENSEEPRI
jgi:hypothetical protein